MPLVFVIFIFKRQRQKKPHKFKVSLLHNTARHCLKKREGRRGNQEDSSVVRRT